MAKNIRIVYEGTGYGSNPTFYLAGEFECLEDCPSCILKFNCLTNDSIYNENSYINISTIGNHINDIPYKITWFGGRYEITIYPDGSKVVNIFTD